jgi:hypothetical protein
MCSRDAVGARVPVSRPQEKTSILSGPMGIGACRQMREQVTHIEPPTTQVPVDQCFGHRFPGDCVVIQVDRENISAYHGVKWVTHCNLAVRPSDG